MFLLVLFLSYFNRVDNLQCIDKCSMLYSMNQPFILPPSCSSILANRCSVKLVFWYDRLKYSVSFTAESSQDQNVGDNRQFMMIETAKNRFFSYDIHHVCKETNECARRFAEQKISQMTNRSYNISRLYSDLQRLLYDKSAGSKNLACFNINDDVRQCTVPEISGSCQIIDDLIKHKVHRRLCLRNARESASVNIYDFGNFAMLTVKCNRMLCNGPLTIAAVKKVLQHHNVTDVHGRLTGNSLRTHDTAYLLLLMVFLSCGIKSGMTVKVI